EMILKRCYEQDSLLAKVRLLEAELLEAKGTPEFAAARLILAYQQNKTSKEIILKLTDFLIRMNKLQEAYSILYEATKLNNRNTQLWYQFAIVCDKISMPEQAGYCALQASIFATSEASKKQILTEFSKQIEQYKQKESEANLISN
ncbi:MAG: hypothetical protein NZ108_07465, partial [Bacteroidia bacterium]|nr:hypothetical protein [Bacteroidia bacterium]